MPTVRTGAAALLAACLALPAGAVTFGTAQTQEGTLSITPAASGSTGTVTFEWPDQTTVARGFIEFTADAAFALDLTSYTGFPANDANQPSVYSLFSLDTNAYVHGCGQFATCGWFTPSDAPQPLLADVAAGDYRLEFRETGDPDTGTVVFTISEVPLPAPALLLLAGLAGLGLAGRRRAA